MSSHRIQEIPSLPWFPHLQSLYLQDNMIATCAAMENLPSLGILNLAHNCLESIDILRALLPLSAIERLDLNGNPVEDDPRFVSPNACTECTFLSPGRLEWEPCTECTLFRAAHYGMGPTSSPTPNPPPPQKKGDLKENRKQFTVVSA